MLIMFGIPNCDTVKKARTFLEKHQLHYEFVDFKKTPPTPAQLTAWTEYIGELPVNKKGTTYRKYKDQYEGLINSDKIGFIIANPSIIKRPILQSQGKVIAIGFAEAEYDALTK